MAADRLPDPGSQEWQDAYYDAMQRRDWQECDRLLDERDYPPSPVSAAVSPAKPPGENESERMLLVAVGRLFGWGVVRYEQNMGGGWFTASEVGTAPVSADEVRRLYEEERKRRDG